MLGNFWPGCKQEDKFTWFPMIVLAYDSNWKANESSSPRQAFKVALQFDDDSNCAAPDRKEGALRRSQRLVSAPCIPV